MRTKSATITLGRASPTTAGIAPAAGIALCTVFTGRNAALHGGVGAPEEADLAMARRRASRLFVYVPDPRGGNLAPGISNGKTGGKVKRLYFKSQTTCLGYGDVYE